jgi:hypothetical protein
MEQEPGFAPRLSPPAVQLEISSDAVDMRNLPNVSQTEQALPGIIHVEKGSDKGDDDAEEGLRMESKSSKVEPGPL